MLLNCGVGVDSWESLDSKEIHPVHPRWNQSWIFIGRTDAEGENTLATWCKELTHWKRPWCWEILKVRGEGDDRGWDGWIASLTWWTWVWTSSGSWWWTGRRGVLQYMRSQSWIWLGDWTFYLDVTPLFWIIPLAYGFARSYDLSYIIVTLCLFHILSLRIGVFYP